MTKTLNARAVSDRPGPRLRLPPFARAWFANPRRVGAIAPSGQSLARLITSELDAASAPVIEIGPGTGVFTAAILAAGIAPEQLALIEASTGLAQTLRTRFPAVRVLDGDASTFRAGSLFGLGAAGAVISGIPVLSMRDADVRALMAFAFGELRAGGCFYQFTYGTTCPVRLRVLRDMGLTATRIGTTLQNLPPASVYRIGRSGDAAASRV